MNAKITIVDTAAPVASRATVLQPDGAKLQLTRTRGASVRGARGWSVHVMRGAVWITRDGDIRDIVVEAGQAHVLDNAGPFTLWSLGEGDTYLAFRPHVDTAERQGTVTAAGAVFA